MNGKLVETSMGCVGVSKETVVNLVVSLKKYTEHEEFFITRCINLLPDLQL